MGTTASKALRYPEPTEQVQDGHLAIRHLAEDVDAALNTTAWAAPAGGAAGWTHNSRLRRFNGVCYLYVSVTRTGAAIGPASAVGNIVDETILTVAAGNRPGQLIATAFDVGGTKGGIGTLGTDGSVTLKSLYPTASVATGDSVFAFFVYPQEA